MRAVVNTFVFAICLKEIASLPCYNTAFQASILAKLFIVNNVSCGDLCKEANGLGLTRRKLQVMAHFLNSWNAYLFKDAPKCNK